MLRKVAKDKKIVSRLFYPSSKKELTTYKNIGIEKVVIAKSNLSIFERHVIENAFMYGKHFIRIHNDDHSDELEYSNYRAFLIHCGDVVEFKNTKVLIRCGHPTGKEQKANRVIKFLQ